MARARGPAADLHGGLPDPSGGRLVRFCEVSRPALVLGSTQAGSDVDPEAARAAGVDVVHRRSGGGAVLVAPGDVLWAEVVVPAGDPRWEADVGRATWWVGEAWVAALASLGVRAAAHRGPMVRTPWSARVCFAGLGPGEVTLVGPGSPKVVGISQRRTRGGAVLQCAALLRWDAAGLARLFPLDGPARDAAVSDLAPVATGLAAAGVTADRLEAAFLASLPD